jgi:nicotinamide-nucleotide amidase
MQIASRMRQRGQRLVTAESCTGGLIAAACTTLAGSSDWFDRGFVTYANAAKTAQLGVPAALITQHGAVSEAVAHAMAAGALAQADAQWSVAVTGIAGPGGGSFDKPVGLVWLAWGSPSGIETEAHRFDGDRAAVRSQAVGQALAGLWQRLQRPPVTA